MASFQEDLSMAEFHTHLQQELTSLETIPNESKLEIYRILSVLAQHDVSSAVHSMRVARYMAVMALLAERTLPEIEGHFVCGLMHDGGKKDVPKEILCKQGRLSPVEMEEIYRHVSADCPTLAYVGDLMVKDGSTMWFNAWQAMAYHHANPAGTGYGPQGLQERGGVYQISEVAVATHFCDVWDARNTRTDRIDRDAPIVPGWSDRKSLDEKLEIARDGFRVEGFSDEQTAGLVGVAKMAIWSDSTLTEVSLLQAIRPQLGFQDSVDIHIVRGRLSESL